MDSNNENYNVDCVHNCQMEHTIVLWLIIKLRRLQLITLTSFERCLLYVTMYKRKGGNKVVGLLVSKDLETGWDWGWLG